MREPLVGHTTQQAQGVSPARCQTTAEMSTPRREKSPTMKLNAKTHRQAAKRQSDKKREREREQETRFERVQRSLRRESKSESSRVPVNKSCARMMRSCKRCRYDTFFFFFKEKKKNIVTVGQNPHLCQCCCFSGLLTELDLRAKLGGVN